MNSDAKTITRVNLGENTKEDQYKTPHLLDIQRSNYLTFVGLDGAKELNVDCGSGLPSEKDPEINGAYRRIIEEYFQDWHWKSGENSEVTLRLATEEDYKRAKVEDDKGARGSFTRNVWIESSDGLEAIEKAKQEGTTYAATILAWIAYEEKVGKPEDDAQDKKLKIKQCEVCQIPAMTPWGTFVVNGAERVVSARLAKLPGLYFVRDGEDGISAVIFTEKGVRLTITWEEPRFGGDPGNAKPSRYVVYQGKGKNRKLRDELTGALNAAESEDIPLEISKACRKTLGKEWFRIGALGRESLVSKGIEGDKEDQEILDLEDLRGIVKELDSVAEKAEDYHFDDLNQLTSKRVVLSGELIGNLLASSLRKQRFKIQKSIQDFMSDERKLCLSGRITRNIFREFSHSTYVQHLDETNLLAEISQKRKITIVSEKGYGGGKDISEVMRHVQRSHYGRICPVETPEGEKVGVVTTFAQMASVDEKGIIRTPYLKPGAESGLEFLSASEEEDETILSFGAKGGKACDDKSPYQEYRSPYWADSWGLPRPMGRDESSGGMGRSLRDLVPGQMLSPASALIPFVEHDDGHRALMGAKMQCQAVPLLHPEAPFVGTGMEKRIVRESMVVPCAGHSGTVSYADGNRILISHESPEGAKGFEEVELESFERTRGKGCKHFRPIVKVGDKVSEGDVLADGYSSEKGELAIGANLLAAYMCWEGYNFEDGIVISDRLVKEDVLSSIHFHEVVVDVLGFMDEMEGSEKTLGIEENKYGEDFVGVVGITEEQKQSIQQSGEFKGAVRVGTYVRPGDILVAKKRAVKAEDLSRQALFLSAVWRAVNDEDFGTPEYEWVNTSERVPDGIEGIVVDVKKTVFPSEGIQLSYTFTIAQKRRIQVGDKLAGRHGNKGVISKIVKASEMPYLPDGTPVDIVLNPLGVPSRLNFGQLYECALGWAAKHGIKWGSSGWKLPDDQGDGLPTYFACPSFDGPTLGMVRGALEKTNEYLDGLSETDRVFVNHMNDGKGKLVLRDGRTGKQFDNPVTVGYAYMMKLDHMVEDKAHARSAGSHYSIKEQPLKGRAAHGGQRLGEMEFWALESHGAHDLAREFLTAKSDHIKGRKGYYKKLVHSKKPELGDADGETVAVDNLLFTLRALRLKPNYNEEAKTFSLEFATEEDVKGWCPNETPLTTSMAYSFEGSQEKGKTARLKRPCEGGLFDEAIFGKNGEDAYRMNMGRIELAVPVRHPWFKEEKDKDKTITILPVLPAGMRPLLEMRGGSFMQSDINSLYADVIDWNERLKFVYEFGKSVGYDPGVAAGSVSSDEENGMTFQKLVKRLENRLQQAVNNLLDNGAEKDENQTKGSSGDALKSLADTFVGKGGIFRHDLLGKRVDFSGRSVICSGGIELQFDECGLPLDLALKLYEPQLIGYWLRRKEESLGSKKVAKRLIRRKPEETRKALEEILEDYPYVLLNRNPSLQRACLQVYRPKITEEKAIRLHPLSCKGFNGDFDGDTMSVYVPLSKEAQDDAEKMIAHNNILSPANGHPFATPSQDMVLGLFWLTRDDENKTFGLPGEGKVEVWSDGGKTEASSGEGIQTTQGRIDLFTKLWDVGQGYGIRVPFLNEQVGKKRLSEYVESLCKHNEEKAEGVSKLLDVLMVEGFAAATESGLSVSLFDGFPEEREDKDKFFEAFEEGGSEAMDNSLYAMVKSGARGDKNQLYQLLCRRGVLKGSYGNSLPEESCIDRSLLEGVSPLQFWTSAYGSRKDVIDKALETAKPGEFTRTLAFALQDLCITEEDCGTKRGIKVDVNDEDAGSKLTGRFLAVDFGEKWGAGTLIKRGEDVDEMRKSNPACPVAVVRSPLTCKSKQGICRKCYGIEPASQKEIELNMPVGLLAAQSLGEPTTQMTLDKFHAGGESAGGQEKVGRKTGLARIQELLSGEVEWQTVKALAEDTEIVMMLKKGFDVRCEGVPPTIKEKEIIGCGETVYDGEFCEAGIDGTVVSVDENVPEVVIEKTEKTRKSGIDDVLAVREGQELRGTEKLFKRGEKDVVSAGMSGWVSAIRRYLVVRGISAEVGLDFEMDQDSAEKVAIEGELTIAKKNGKVEETRCSAAFSGFKYEVVIEPDNPKLESRSKWSETNDVLLVKEGDNVERSKNLFLRGDKDVVCAGVKGKVAKIRKYLADGETKLKVDLDFEPGQSFYKGKTISGKMDIKDEHGSIERKSCSGTLAGFSYEVDIAKRKTVSPRFAKRSGRSTGLLPWVKVGESVHEKDNLFREFCISDFAWKLDNYDEASKKLCFRKVLSWNDCIATSNQLVDEIASEYGRNHIDIDRKHIEVVVRKIFDLNRALANDGSVDKFTQSIEYAAKHSGSFLASAAYGSPKAVLRGAVVDNVVDCLEGVFPKMIFCLKAPEMKQEGVK